MKILFLTRSPNCGGAERQLVALTLGLRQRGRDVAIAVLYSGGPLETELREASIRVLSLNKKGRWDLAGFLMRLVKLVLYEQPDILHAYTDNLFTVAAQPLVHTTKIVWGVRSSEVDFSRYDWLFRVSYWLSCRLSRTADLIIANSHAGKKVHVDDGYPANKMIVIPNGIDTNRFRFSGEGRKRVRHEWHIDESDLLVGMVVRLDPMKDHDTFSHAAALFLKVRPTARFVCVGDGPSGYRAVLQKRVSDLGLTDHVIWTGMRSDVDGVLSALDVLVSSSAFGEGFSNVIGEAMACGVPCVVTNVGDSGFIVGQFGEVVASKNPVAITNAIERLLARKIDPAAIRRSVVERFSLGALIQSTERQLLDLCHQLPKPIESVAETLCHNELIVDRRRNVNSGVET